MSIFANKDRKYLDIDYVEGVYRYDPKMEHSLHELCRDYYEKNFHRSGIDGEDIQDIFQNAELALWENIRRRRLYVENGELKGRDGEPFTSSLTTYFMAIVNNKYLECLRGKSVLPPLEPGKEKAPEYFSEEEMIEDFKYDDDIERRLAIITNRINHLAKRCNEILTLFYYEEKDYDEIMHLMPTFISKDALKTAKYKCLKRLRESVTGTYC